MARPKKQTVDYFPHFVKGGRTIFILENKFGNDGYAFWFKLLEILGESEGWKIQCKLLGLYAPEKKDINGNVSFASLLIESGLLDEPETQDEAE